jgi:hypothetical protein
VGRKGCKKRVYLLYTPNLEGTKSIHLRGKGIFPYPSSKVCGATNQISHPLPFPPLLFKTDHP